MNGGIRIKKSLHPKKYNYTVLIKFIRPFIDLLFYGNFWIALGAISMSWQTQFLFNGDFKLSPYVGFVGFSTLMLYALHRIVGLKKVRIFTDTGRYFVIEKFKKHILAYAFLGGIGALFCFFQLSWTLWAAMIIPAILSVGYVLPILGGKKRLRDLNQVKIFLVAVVWAWITVGLVVIDESLWQENTLSIFLLLSERTFFIFAITIPFDIRDLKVDAHTNVSTIPSRYGIPKAKALSTLLLALMVAMAFLNWTIGFYTFNTLLALSISALSTCFFIRYSDKVQDDYFFTGLIDGLMLLQFLLVLLLS